MLEERLFSSAIVSDATIGHNGILKMAAFEIDSESSYVFRPETSISEISSNQDSFLEINRFQLSSTENSVGQNGSTERGFFDNRITQVSFSHIRTKEASLAETTTSQIGFTENSGVSFRLPKFGISHHGFAEISPSNVTFPKINVSQIGFTKNNSAHVNFNIQEVAIPQNNSTQIQSFEPIEFGRERATYDINITKISFPTSIMIDEVRKQNFSHN